MKTADRWEVGGRECTEYALIISLKDAESDVIARLTGDAAFRADMGPVLDAFARECARSVLDHWTEGRGAPEVVAKYLEQGGEDLRAAAYACTQELPVDRHLSKGVWAVIECSWPRDERCVARSAGLTAMTVETIDTEVRGKNWSEVHNGQIARLIELMELHLGLR